MDLKEDFLVLKNNKNICYLDNAASSLKPRQVEEGIAKYYNEFGCNVNRGVYPTSFHATKIYDEARQKLADFIGADFKEVIFTRGASSALNLVALSYGLDNVLPGDEIITSELEHHSNVLPWQRVARLKSAKLNYLPLDSFGRITVENFKKVLTNKTKVVALTHVSNVLGYLTPIKEIIELAHSVGAVVILDAAQSIPHIKIDCHGLDVDFLAFSLHKMCGPTGLGILYGKKSLLEKMEPVELGGDMNDEVSKYSVTYKDLPYKFETGTPPISAVFGVIPCLDYLKEVGYDFIENHTKELVQYAVKEMLKIDGLKVYNFNEENKNLDSSIIAFNIEGVHAHDSVTYFAENNVCLRSGHHCAELIHKWLDVPATLRASFYFYNTKEDVDYFLNVLNDAVAFFKAMGF